MLMPLLLLLLALVATATGSAALALPRSAGSALTQPRSTARGPRSAPDDCKAGVCGGSASYPVAPGIRFYATFNVPGLPLNKTAIESDVTFFIYRAYRA